MAKKIKRATITKTVKKGKTPSITTKTVSKPGRPGAK